MSGKTRSQRAMAGVSLLLECEEEELSEAQKEAQIQSERDYKDAVDKINEMLKNHTVRQRYLKLTIKSFQLLNSKTQD